MKISSEKIIVVTGRAIDALGALVFLKMVSTLAPKNEVGQYMLASSLLAAMLTVSYSALDQGLLRNVTEYEGQGSLGARYSALLVTYLASSFVLSAALATALSALGVAPQLHDLHGALTLWLAFEAAKNLNITLASGLRSRQLILGASVIDYACRLALLWVAARGFGMLTARDVLHLLAAASLAATLTFVWGHRSLLSRFSWPQARDSLADAIRFSWPMIVWGLFGWLQNMSNRWILERFADLDAVAEYGVLVSIATFPVTALLGVVGTYVVPILYERESVTSGASQPLVRRLALCLLPPVALMVTLVALFHRDLVVLLSREAYAAHSYVLPMIMAAASLSAVASVLTYAVYAQRRVSSLLLANTMPGAFTLAFGSFAVQRHGFQGAIVTLVLSHIVAALLFVVAYSRLPKRVAV